MREVPAVVEGAVELRIRSRPPGSKGPGAVEGGPFYNPAMRFSRDLSVLALTARMQATRHDKPFRIYDGLAASGARGLRLAKECRPRAGQAVEVVCNDRDHEAGRGITHHARINGLEAAIVVRSHDFADGFLGERFDHIDIDPFGSPMPFVDAAIRHARNGATVAATATDVAALCGVHPSACRRRYDATPWHGPAMHEVALRILAGALVRHAARYDKAARPVLMHATDHYVRVYVELVRGAQRADRALGMIGFACEHADGTRRLHARLDPVPGDAVRVAGPLWTGPLHDVALLRSMSEAAADIPALGTPETQRFLVRAAEESVLPGLHYEVGELSRRAAGNAPSLAHVLGALRDAGWSAGRTHVSPAAFRTDAPMAVLLALWKGDPLPQPA